MYILTIICIFSVQKQQVSKELLSPEQTELGQQSRVGAALLRAGLARCVMLCTETFDLCQDLSGK